MKTILLTIIIVLIYALSGTATTMQQASEYNYPEGSDMYECQSNNNCGEDFMNDGGVNYE